MVEMSSIMYRKPRILCVDDEPSGRLHRKRPGASGIDVGAHSGQETWRITDCREIDLVLLDIYMPDMDGEVCRGSRRAPDAYSCGHTYGLQSGGASKA